MQTLSGNAINERIVVSNNSFLYIEDGILSVRDMFDQVFDLFLTLVYLSLMDIGLAFLNLSSLWVEPRLCKSEDQVTCFVKHMMKTNF